MQKHLVRVYATLAVGVLVCCIGTVVGQYLSIGILIPSLAYLGLSMWLLTMQTTSSNKWTRQRVFAGAALAQGITLAPLVALAGQVNPMYVCRSVCAWGNGYLAWPSLLRMHFSTQP